MTPTASAIRAALAAVSPVELPLFDAELAAAGADRDALLGRWWGIAELRLHPLTPAERAAVERFRNGDFTRFLTRNGDGRWVQL